MTQTDPVSSPSDWFGQPRGLTILFLTEMWEKFSFFGMRALLVYYMTKQLAFANDKASYIYGVYAAFVYLTPVIGGAIADKWLGRRRAVILGGSIMVAGHFMMVFPTLFYPALAAIAIGNGFFLPNLPSQIDGLFRRDDPRRGSAFNVYYVGINLGAFLAPLICGTLGELYGWHYGFGAAGIGMLLGLSIYTWGARWLPPEPLRSRQEPGAGPQIKVWPKGLVAMMLGIILAVVIFRGAYEQMGNSVALWADADVDRHVGGFQIPGSWFQSLNPLLVFALTPLLLWYWMRAARRGAEPSPLRKMAYGAGGVMVAYALLAMVSTYVANPHWLWLVAFIGVYPIAELHILPIGLSLFARWAPQQHQAKMIAAWFLASFAGNLLAGVLGANWGRVGPTTFFLWMAVCSGIALVLLMGLSVFARRVQLP